MLTVPAYAAVMRQLHATRLAELEQELCRQHGGPLSRHVRIGLSMVAELELLGGDAAAVAELLARTHDIAAQEALERTAALRESAGQA